MSADAEKILTAFLRRSHEWLLVDCAGRSFALQTAEIEIETRRGKLFFGFLDDKGFQTWRIGGFEIKDEKITLDLTRNFEKHRARITLVPRISALELGAISELARRERARRLAEMFAAATDSKIVRAELNDEHGRFAQIIAENRNGKQTAVLADVTDALAPETLLAAAIFWLRKLQNRRQNPIDAVSILAEKKQARAAQKLRALLRNSWQKRISVMEISRAKTQSENDLQNTAEVNALPILRISDLRREKAKKIQPVERLEQSAAARKIIELAPGEIDAVISRHGETLRFRGLPFARVRKISGAEKVWFGAEAKRQILSEKTFEDFEKLIDELKFHRRADAPNKRHDFYRLAPEAWLESVLRRNVKLLDANLILSPLYHQFRAECEKIDLLALRRDGRLVIIELKIAPDREMIFQAADYWRKIESARKSGNLQKAKIFGDAEIKDEPALVFLVAPTLAFHRDFSFLAATVSEEIEIYRFDLNEDWRREIRVLGRRAI